MENVELEKQLVDLFNQIKVAKTLVDEGKEVSCSQQLQGAKTRCLHIIEDIRGTKDVVADKAIE